MCRLILNGIDADMPLGEIAYGVHHNPYYVSQEMFQDLYSTGEVVKQVTPNM